MTPVCSVTRLRNTLKISSPFIDIVRALGKCTVETSHATSLHDLIFMYDHSKMSMIFSEFF
jgi:hypothetical protein